MKNKNITNTILVTGGSGLLGKHLKELWDNENVIYVSSKEFDLTNEQSVRTMFKFYSPKAVVHLAAQVGGIMDNMKHPVKYLNNNIKMDANILKWAEDFGTPKVIGMLSTCIYPDQLTEDQYPMKEELLHDGPPAKTNFSYGYAKRCMAVQMSAYNEEFGTNYQYLTPCNLYGEHDNFEHDQKAHFITALIKKIDTALKNNNSTVQLFGTGSPLRQFMYAGDLAKIIIDCVENDYDLNMNVAVPWNYSIKEMAEIALKACDAEHLKIEFDTSKPDGQYRKDASTEKFEKTFPEFEFTSLEEGIRKVYQKIK